MSTRRSFIVALFAVIGFLSLGATSAKAQSIKYLVVNNANGRLYEVRDGSGTGGRFVSQNYSVGGVGVSGYTDRASRNEYILILFEGSGVSQYVGLRSDNRVLNSRAANVALPTYAFGRVWLNPNVDNVYAYAKMPNKAEVSKRLPIGTR